MQPPQADYIFRGHQEDVNFIRFFNNDKYLASCDAGGVVIVWLFQTRRPLFQWQAHTASCLSVHVYNKDKLVSQGRDDMIHVWQLDFDTHQNPRVIYTLPYYSLNFCQLSLYETKDDNQDTLICFPSKGDTPLVDIFNLNKQSWVLQNIGDQDQDNEKRRLCMTVQFIHHDQYPIVHLLVGYESGHAVLWQCHLESKNSVLLWQTHLDNKPVLCLKGTYKGGYALSGSVDDEIVKLDLDNGQIIKKMKTKKSGTASVSIRKDNKIFATGGYDGRIRIYSVKTMKPLAVLSYHRDSVYSVDFASNGMDQEDGNNSDKHWVIGCSKDHRISLWHVY